MTNACENDGRYHSTKSDRLSKQKSVLDLRRLTGCSGLFCQLTSHSGEHIAIYATWQYARIMLLRDP